MLIEKAKLFVVITLSSCFIFTLLYAVVTLIKVLFFDVMSLYAYSDIRDGFVTGIFVGLIHSLVFIIFDWQNKLNYLPYMVLLKFVIFELILILGLINAHLNASYQQLIDYQADKYSLFLDHFGIAFVKASLFILLFSIIASIINKKLLTRIKSKSILL